MPLNTIESINISCYVIYVWFTLIIPIINGIWVYHVKEMGCLGFNKILGHLTLINVCKIQGEWMKSFLYYYF